MLISFQNDLQSLMTYFADHPYGRLKFFLGVAVFIIVAMSLARTKDYYLGKAHEFDKMEIIFPVRFIMIVTAAFFLLDWTFARSDVMKMIFLVPLVALLFFGRDKNSTL